jgi:hypothetical protein
MTVGGDKPTYVDDVFSTTIYKGKGAISQDIVNGIELGDRPPGMVQSLEFPVGAEYGIQTNGTSLGTSQWVMEYWCKFTAEPTTTMAIYDARFSGTDKLSWRLVGGELKLLQNGKPDFDTGYYPWVDSPNKWAYHVLTLSDGVISFFVDGIRVATQSITGAYSASTANIGRSTHQSGIGLGGCLLSNFRINTYKGYATSLTLPVPEGASRIESNTTTLLFTESDIAPGTECLNNTSNTDPVLYDRAQGDNMPGSRISGDLPSASADSPYPNGGYEGKGGLVWLKERSLDRSHFLFDTERGEGKRLSTNSTEAESSFSNESLQSFNSDGFTIGDFYGVSDIGEDFASWTFAKQEGFFDVVTWTGNGVAGREIPHNLGSTPGMIIMKSTTLAQGWTVYHRSLGATQYLRLDESVGATTAAGTFNNTEPTDSVFTLGAASRVNDASADYVAYVFATEVEEFGDKSDESVIKCGSYTGTGVSLNEVDFGFEPQWLLVKPASAAGDWTLFDEQRGLGFGAGDLPLYANMPNDEGSIYNWIALQGHVAKVGPVSATHFNAAGVEYVYMAIRRSHKPPSQSADVFDVRWGDNGAKSPPTFQHPFTVDMAWYTSGQHYLGSRVVPRGYLATHQAGSLVGSTEENFTYPAGYGDWATNQSSVPSYAFKRASGFFDVQGYYGGQSERVPHNLGVAPEMIWIKRLDSTYSGNWVVACEYTSQKQHSGWPEPMYLNSSDGSFTGVRMGYDADNFWTDSGSNPNSSSSNGQFIAFLWASLPGICDIGSYMGTGSDLNIDCGFTHGSRFVLIKRQDADGDWMYFDTLRGISSSNSTIGTLNNSPYIGGTGTGSYIKPFADGFTATSNLTGIDGAEYIYMAIA